MASSAPADDVCDRALDSDGGCSIVIGTRRGKTRSWLEGCQGLARFEGGSAGSVAWYLLEVIRSRQRLGITDVADYFVYALKFKHCVRLKEADRDLLIASGTGASLSTFKFLRCS